MRRLKRWLTRKRKKEDLCPQPQQLQNPYRRIYTEPKSLEQLARKAREADKKQNQQN